MNGFRVSAYSTNLADGHYFYLAGGLRYASPPRQFGVRASKSF